VVLEKDCEYQLDRSCENGEILHNQTGKEYPINSTNKEGSSKHVIEEKIEGNS